MQFLSVLVQSFIIENKRQQSFDNMNSLRKKKKGSFPRDSIDKQAFLYF